MATKRCIPTRFFKDPDIINLRKDTQLILIGLVLNADDEGRAIADPKILGREVDFPPDQMEAALQELAENHLIVLYQGERHRYYSLTQQWQSMGKKMTPSKFPAPPIDPRRVFATSPEDSGLSDGNDDVSRKNDGLSDGNAGTFPEKDDLSDGNPAQLNSIQSNLIEDEESALPSFNVITFPTPTTSDNASVPEVRKLTHQAARILKLEVSEALIRIVQEYHSDPALSILGEADAAREWCDDPVRNKKKQRMTPAFFRRWLKREQLSQQQQAKALKVPNASGQSPGSEAPPGLSPSGKSRGLASRSLMGLSAQYQLSPTERTTEL
jgi:hypothetical protein